MLFKIPLLTFKAFSRTMTSSSDRTILRVLKNLSYHSYYVVARGYLHLIKDSVMLTNVMKNIFYDLN